MGTAVAAFVGPAPGGPLNSPVRVSRWGQFAKVYGDPKEPDNGPFMEGAFLAHAVYGFFQNGGSLCWVVRVGGSTRRDLGGDVEERSGLVSLAAIDEVTMVCMPDAMTLARDGDEAELTALQGNLIAHCENAGNRMAILDCPPRLSPREILDWRTSVPGYYSNNAALYYPWLEVADPLTGRLLLVPPSGHVAGVWCRTDASYGVHRAPTEGVLGVAGLGSDVAESDQAELEEAGVNSIRAFPGQGIRVWGARTLSSDPEWRYLPVRRVFLHLACSIDRGTRWTVFEPNDERLWEKLREQVEHFLDRSWRDGALAGETAKEAYYVKCDAETNPSQVIEAGQVVCEIGIAPGKPREFAILRLSRARGRCSPSTRTRGILTSRLTGRWPRGGDDELTSQYAATCRAKASRNPPSGPGLCVVRRVSDETAPVPWSERLVSWAGHARVGRGSTCGLGRLGARFARDERERR